MLKVIENTAHSQSTASKPLAPNFSTKLCESEFEQIGLDKIPKDHPVAKFAEIYSPMIKGFLLPDARDIVSRQQIQKIGNWVQILEPVRRGLRLDFRTFNLEKPDTQTEPDEPKWLTDFFEDDFAVPRLQEATVVSVLREPLFSRGTVPSRQRNFIRQYRGVFPLFADIRSRMCLAVVAAETFLSVNLDES